MKRIVSTLIVLFIVGVTSISAQCDKKNDILASSKTSCCSKASTGEKKDCSSQKVEKTEVMAYYFHATRRCATCEAVEKTTRETLKNTYGDKVNFVSINREEDENKAMVEKYKINAQTLIFVKGDDIVDLTSNAFLNARTNPEKLEKKIKSTVDKMLK